MGLVVLLEWLPFANLLLVAWGLVDTFWGYRAFRYTLTLLGAFAGSAGGGFLGFELSGQDPTMLLVGLGGGLLMGAVAAIYFYRLAVAILGGFLTVVVITPFLAWMPPWLEEPALILVVVIGAVSSAAVADPMIRVGTAFTGAFRVVAGTWYFWGGPNVLAFIYEPGVGWDALRLAGWPLMAGLLLGLMGWWSQVRGEGRRRSSRR